MDLALSHLRVIDLSTENGWFCGRVLAELGADVIKVEPAGGDPGRLLPPFKGGTPHPEGSLRFMHYNTGKRSIVLDIEHDEADRDRFRRLVRGADVVIESFTPGTLEQWELGYDALSIINPNIVLTSVTPFGQTGPRAKWQGNDFIANALGGQTFLVGVPGLAPNTPPNDQVAQMAGVHAAWGTLLALFNRWGLKRGQHVDVSLQEIAAHEFFVMTRYSAKDALIVGRTMEGSGIVPNTIYPAKDGMVRISIFETKQYTDLANWIGDEALQSPEFELREVRNAAAEFINGRISEWSSQLTVQELLDGALEHHIPMGPMNTPEQFMESVYATHRGLFVEREHPYIGKYRTVKQHLTFSKTPMHITSAAPLLDQHRDAILAEIEEHEGREPVPASVFPFPGSRPFDGLRVLDFTRVWAGPYGARYLADHGAEVIKVESHLRQDSRPQPGLPDELQIQSFVYFSEPNRNKDGITVNLKNARGLEIIKDIIRHCDVVLENNAPGVMDRLGIGYEDMKEVRPDLIFVSMPGFGAGTPHSGFPAYGGTLNCYTGMTYMWAAPDTPATARCQLAYPDYIAAAHVPLAILAALHHRARTGEGQYVEIPQIDGTAQFLALNYLDSSVNGTEQVPMGNTSHANVPQNLYRARGDDRWIAISVRNDEEWQRFCKAVQHPDWAQDERFTTLEGRTANREALDALIAGWTAYQTPHQCMRILQAHGVPAGVVATGEDLYYDEHMRARGYVLALDHPGIGSFEHPGYTVGLSETPGRFRKPAPTLGADTETVMMRVLGWSPAESKALMGDGDALF